MARPHELHCFLCDVSTWSPSLAEWETAMRCISDPASVERIMRYHKGYPSSVGFPRHQHPDTKCFAIGRLMLQLVTARSSSSNPRDVTLARTAEGKPYPTNPELLLCGWNINMSHAGSLVVAAAGSCGGIIGVDVMPVELVPRPAEEQPGETLQLTREQVIEFFSCFRSYYTASEWDWVEHGNVAPIIVLMRFYVLWTLKEAYIKAVGIGLGFEVQRAEFSFAGTDVTDPDFFATFVDDVTGGLLETSTKPAAKFFSPNVSLRIDGKEQGANWRFLCFRREGGDDDGRGVSVGAIALGPFDDASGSSFRDVVSLRQKNLDAAGPSMAQTGIYLCGLRAADVVEQHSRSLIRRSTST